MLDKKFRKLFWTQFRSFYRASGESSVGDLTDDAGIIDFRYEHWSNDVKDVLTALSMPADFDTHSVEDLTNPIYIYAFIQRKGWDRKTFNAIQFTESVNALMFKNMKDGGTTGQGVWHYD